jgi:hypothetical protein
MFIAISFYITAICYLGCFVIRLNSDDGEVWAAFYFYLTLIMLLCAISAVPAI